MMTDQAKKLPTKKKDGCTRLPYTCLAISAPALYIDFYRF